MAYRKSIAQRGKRRHAVDDRPLELQLTSLIDILVIILVFLLKTYDTTAVNFYTPPDLVLPKSNSPIPAVDALNLFVSQKSITLGPTSILEFKRGAFLNNGQQVLDAIDSNQIENDEGLILPLYDALKEKRSRVEAIAAQTGGDKFSGKINLVADSRIHYAIIKKILYTSAAAGFVTIKFSVQKIEGT